jgi:hypothetical protein
MVVRALEGARNIAQRFVPGRKTFGLGTGALLGIHQAIAALPGQAAESRNLKLTESISQETLIADHRYRNRQECYNNCNGNQERRVIVIERNRRSRFNVNIDLGIFIDIQLGSSRYNNARVVGDLYGNRYFINQNGDCYDFNGNRIQNYNYSNQQNIIIIPQQNNGNVCFNNCGQFQRHGSLTVHQTGKGGDYKWEFNPFNPGLKQSDTYFADFFREKCSGSTGEIYATWFGPGTIPRINSYTCGR